ncbi:unnamed protein product, partial [Sphagnum troendelagicum]
PPHRNGCIRSPIQTLPPPAPRSSGNCPALAEFKLPAHTAPSFPLRGTTLSESSPKTAMEPCSSLPRVCSRQV